MTQRTLDELRTGITVDGIKYREIEAAVDRVQGSNLWLTFAIREGKNREVRNVLGHLGLRSIASSASRSGRFSLAS